MRSPKTVLSAALGLGLAASLAAAVPAVASPSAAPTDNRVTAAQYVGSAAEKADTKRFFEAVMKSALAKQKKTGAASVTVTYNPSGAPTFAQQISASAQIWNSAVSNVKLQASSSGADFSYREGNDPRGSYASTDGHGSGYVFLDYQQNQEYDSTRVTTHETGHVLGLPDHYEGPCSELMSGGGPGPSCTNSQPDANERAKVDQLWANGLKAVRSGAAS
ncbi:snapalysin [Streptomyces olivaceiscleroticus]|uniref:Extracellular small neutral protease n=1 Tax=Streptomyces olivaceiscleroticus TaxID=68245 RepID=A0ABN0ZQ75_9ACTN